MNRYSVNIPYSFITYGHLTGTIEACDVEEASDLIRDTGNIDNVEYDDGDGDSTEYDFSNADIELEEEYIDDEYSTPKEIIPSYYLAEILQL